MHHHLEGMEDVHAPPEVPKAHADAKSVAQHSAVAHGDGAALQPAESQRSEVAPADEVVEVALRLSSAVDEQLEKPSCRMQAQLAHVLELPSAGSRHFGLFLREERTQVRLLKRKEMKKEKSSRKNGQKLSHITFTFT